MSSRDTETLFVPDIDARGHLLLPRLKGTLPAYMIGGVLTLLLVFMLTSVGGESIRTAQGGATGTYERFLASPVSEPIEAQGADYCSQGGKLDNVVVFYEHLGCGFADQIAAEWRRATARERFEGDGALVLSTISPQTGNQFELQGSFTGTHVEIIDSQSGVQWMLIY
ncbi:hypothetical protein BSP99_02095 [Corynebacterium glutamicum]|uniref:Uncharacterized protein n=1 Tax=Corynebacterium gallinarum TaxID=2762214 RepID=A0A8I0HJ51_9CORY|nr:hypothetical protein [Corynebacterium gallinarum]ALP49129.1 hypothetical protein AC079_02225 [Corynebacterium glutamicum]ANU32641.1 hypothetical protein BBD29_02050 [Corynebacterium glutamicum]APT06384.1 hypothetical protein BSP99_02095 [Corynebacterium glutamicum]MBD8031003.1 hypothetical protein [Corynebacterium gallinarum]QWQ83306.1 hypothetical protein B5C28_02060 [Corynebacterium glutamicum]